MAAKVTQTTKLTMDEVIKRLTDSAVTVGVHSDAGKDRNGVTNALKAAVNEFGTDTIPERSFLRSTMAANRRAYMENIAKIAQSAIQGKRTPKKGMGLLGLKAQNDIKSRITSISTPANSAATIKRKKSSNPLINNGDMRESVRWKYDAN